MTLRKKAARPPRQGWLTTAAIVAASASGLAFQEAPPAQPPSSPPPATPAAPAEWHDAAALKSALESLVAGKRELARLTSYGKSRAGRDLWCVAVGMVDHPQRDRLPALLVVAGLDGNHRLGTELVLDHLRRLLDGYGKEPAVTRLLDEHVVYLLPRANPDGAEAAFAAVKREVRGNLRPVDDDRDGALDEDAPEDLNGDGLITQMRFKDPAGTLIEDPENPRYLRPADPLKGERGVWKVGVEGIDRDGDGECAEDGVGDVVPNRNFPQRWQEFDPAAGRVAMDEPEALALGQFVLDHPSIAMALVYGLQDNVAVDAKNDSGGDAPAAGPGGGGGGGFPGGGGGGGGGGGFRANRTMPAGIVRDDQGLYGEVATRYRKTTGVTSKPPVETDDGAFVPFAYFQFGIPTFAVHAWSPPLDVKAPEAPKEPAKEGAKEGGGEAPKKDEPKKDEPKSEPAKPVDAPDPAARGEGGREGGGGRRGRGGGGPGGGGGGSAAKPESDEPKLLLWNDHAMGGAAFVPWTKVRHPTLGEVEVGGWKPYVRVEPPLADVAALAKKHSDFLIELGGLLAELRVGDAKVENLGGGLFRLTATVVNDGWLPSLCAMAERNRRPKSARLDLDFGAAKLLQGQARHTWTRIDGGGGRREVKWLLQAEPGTKVVLRLWSETAGDDERTVELQ